MKVVVGLDPGFAKTGYCVVRLGESLEQDLPIRMGVLKTTKSSHKLRLLAVDDNVRRTQEIAHSLLVLLAEFDVVAITAEAFSFMRNASAAAKVAMTWGVVAAVATVHQIPVMQATPSMIKHKFCHKAGGSKQDVQKAVTALYPHVDFGKLLAQVSQRDHEHPWDAVAATIVCLEDKSIQMLRRLQA